MSHTRFRLVPISVTLNGLERHHSPYIANSIVLEADYVTLVEDRPLPLSAETDPPCSTVAMR